jgi:hypothetical protein
MKHAWMTVPFFQIVIASVSLCLYVLSDTFDGFVSNPFVAYSIMLAFGVADVTSKFAHQEGTKSSDSWKRFPILELLVFMAFAGISIVVSKARVEYDNSILDWCGLVLPSSLVLWLHWRRRLSPLVATAMHYGISLTWAFFSGIIYYHHFNEIYRNDPSRYQFSPMREGMEWLAEMAEWGIVTSSIYFVVTTVFTVLWRRQRVQNEPAGGESGKGVPFGTPSPHHHGMRVRTGRFNEYGQARPRES